jgi:uncharacterized lipoprotein YmbA
MKEAATGSFRRSLALAGITIFLGGCGTLPLPKVYVLGDPSSSPPGVTDEAGLPHIELKTVTVPDYLDTTEIIRRTASNEVVASPTGQWGERLSAGVRHALSADLARRLPNMVIESRETSQPHRRLLVDVERFEIAQDGRCTLTARWRTTASSGKSDSESQRGTFIDDQTSLTDAAAAAAMTSAIDHLAAQIAVTLQSSP